MIIKPRRAFLFLKIFITFYQTIFVSKNIIKFSPVVFIAHCLLILKNQDPQL